MAITEYQPDSTELPSTHTTSDATPVAPEWNKMLGSLNTTRAAVATATRQVNQELLGAVLAGDVTPVDTSLFQRVVAFGTTASTARPTGAAGAALPNGAVYWIGTGTTVPTNALSADLVYLP